MPKAEAKITRAKTESSASSRLSPAMALVLLTNHQRW
jgi:hypothetical protein